MVSESLKQNYRQVFTGAVGFGARPAVLVVDFIRAYTTPGAPLYAEAVTQAARRARPLLEAARARAAPVIFTRVQYSAHGAEGGVFVRKVPVLRTLVAGARSAEIVPELQPDPRDTVLVKQYASAFFGTPLAALLTSAGVDTLILTGCTTSGCIRASAVDGVQHGFRVIVPRECVADRAPEPHEANLFDIQSKYGDVVSADETLAYLKGAPAAGGR